MTSTHPSPASAPAPVCPACGTPRTAEAPDGLCPACLMRGAMQPTAGGPFESGEGLGQGADPEAGVPPLAEVAAAFPQWDVLELLGRGGMGAVYKIRQPKLNRLAALKIIPASFAERDPAFAGRFEREGELLARLHHPNIVTVHDSGRSGEFYYLLMEHVDGVNLRQAMRANRFTPQQALAVVPKICEALQYAHEEGVLHRDIKPENILLDSKGRVKLADFGIAKLLPAASGAAAPPDPSDPPHPPSADPAEVGGGFTQAHSALGTPRYMAPEQAERPREVDHRADIYSLGVVFYELLTGQLPTPGAFAPPSAYAAVDYRVDGIVRQALERERDRRQHSAGEMKTQVETLTNPVSGHSPAAGFRAVSGNSGYTPEEISAAVATLRRNFEYKSTRTVFGLPLLHIAHGYDPVTRKLKAARGIFAFGGTARGVFAFGGRAYGVFAFGGLATGVVAIGGVAIGLFALGGMALALLLALGGMAVGTFASGGMAVGWFCEGGMALGWNATGGMVYAHLGHGGQVFATHIVRAKEALPAGLRFIMGLSSIVPFTGVLMLPAILATILVPVWARQRLERRNTPRRLRRLRLWTMITLAGIVGALVITVRKLAGPIEKIITRPSSISLSAAPPPERTPAATSDTIPAPRSSAVSPSAAPPNSRLEVPEARRLHDLANARYETGLGTQLEVLDARHDLELAEAQAATPPDEARAIRATLNWAKARFDLLNARHQAGMVNQTEVLDARHTLALAEAAAHNDPAAATAATLEWAKAKLDLLTARYQAGLVNQTEVEKARGELLRAEAKAAAPVTSPQPPPAQ